MLRRKKKNIKEHYDNPVELNVMPFIDIFSLLCTFLLFSAVFVTIGILEVQIPFISNSVPTIDEKKIENKRILIVNVDVDLENIELTSSYSKAPIEEIITKFSLTEEGFKNFHSTLLRLKEMNPDADKVTIFIDDKVEYELFIKVLDHIKFINLEKQASEEIDDLKNNSFLFEKVIMGDILL